MILDIYRDDFSRIYIFPPCIYVDSLWLPAKNYIEKEMKVQRTDEDPIYFDHYDRDALHEVLDTKHYITHCMKNQGDKRLFQILLIIDDFAGDPAVTRQSNMLHTLDIRGRRMISTIVAIQKFNAIRQIIWVNATESFVYRLRNMKDLEISWP